MEDLARASGNMFQMHRRGYLYATFEPAAEATLAARLGAYDHSGLGGLRIHDGAASGEPYRAGAPTLDDPLDGHVVGALAGYGTMAACAAGELAAAGVVGATRADYAEALMPGRLGDARYLAALPREANRGEL
jgi:hypothetical protein